MGWPSGKNDIGSIPTKGPRTTSGEGKTKFERSTRSKKISADKKCRDKEY